MYQHKKRYNSSVVECRTWRKASQRRAQQLLLYMYSYTCRDQNDAAETFTIQKVMLWLVQSRLTCDSVTTHLWCVKQRENAHPPPGSVCNRCFARKNILYTVACWHTTSHRQVFKRNVSRVIKARLVLFYHHLRVLQSTASTNSSHTCYNSSRLLPPSVTVLIIL